MLKSRNNLTEFPVASSCKPPEPSPPGRPSPPGATPKVIGANDRIRIGFIGAGGMATSHMHAIHDLREKDNLEPVIVADCWKTRAEAGAKKVGATTNAVTDYRKVLDNKDIDYVTIATPEHWHAQDDARRDGRRQGGLLRKADDAHDARGPAR